MSEEESNWRINIEKDMRSLGAKMDKLVETVAGMGASAGKTPTGVLFGLCALIVSLVTAAATVGHSFMNQEFKRVDNDVYRLETKQEKEQEFHHRFLEEWGKYKADIEHLKES